MKGRKPSAATLAQRLPPNGETPNPPDWLKGAALAEWNRVVPKLAEAYAISALDVSTLAAYCHAYANWRKVVEQVEREGMTYVSEKGEPKLHPLVRQEQYLLAELRRLANDFGFTPTARTRLTAASTTEDELGDFLEGDNDD